MPGNSPPDFEKRTVQRLPSSDGLREGSENITGRFKADDAAKSAGEAVSVVTMVLSAFASIVLFLVIVFYIMIDGKGAFAWLLAFLSTTHRPKIWDAADEMF